MLRESNILATITIFNITVMVCHAPSDAFRKSYESHGGGGEGRRDTDLCRKPMAPNTFVFSGMP